MFLVEGNVPSACYEITARWLTRHEEKEHANNAEKQTIKTAQKAKDKSTNKRMPRRRNKGYNNTTTAVRDRERDPYPIN